MEKRHKIFFAAGIAAVLLMAVPWLALGEDSVMAYFDQLDGEMIAYILQARHLWDGGGLPEFLNGAEKTSLTMPAPACVLLFLGGNYFAALAAMQLLGSLTGYLGMYLLAKDVTGNTFAAVVTAGLYAYLPFLPVYGLAQYGLPLLLWFVLKLRRESCGGGCLWGGILYGVLYAAASSPVLVGFAVLGVLAVWIGAEALSGRGHGEEKKGGIRRMCLCWGAMTAAYVLFNLPLLTQLMGMQKGFLSHKSEYALAGESFWGGWLNGFLYGGQHSEDYHQYFVWPLLIIIAVSIICMRRENAGLHKTMGVLVGCNLALSGVSALWNGAAGVTLRGHLGAVGAFQLDRLLWLCPCLWYLLLACGIAAALSVWSRRRGEKMPLCLAGGAACLLAAAAWGLTGIRILKDSDFKSNVQKMNNADYSAISYRDYYAIGVLGQVEDFLRETTGQSPEEYRVVSIGIDPAAALYHGFYCLDGYSNNYSVEYKHSFRRIIAPELEKSDYLREYFDGWGNRCYLFSSECPGYYTIEKGGFYFQELEIDTEALRELGGEYLFSAAYISNAEELGLKLLRADAFETADSYYRIFLYGITD